MAPRNPDKGTAFLMAAFEGNLPILRSLVPETENGRLLFDRSGRNALHLAAAAGHTRVCKFLVEKLNYYIDFRDDLGSTPLHLAILEEHQQTAVYLIENGAGIECADNRGYNPLHYAAQQGLNKILRLLLSKGAKLVPDKTCWTPLQSACGYGKKDSVKLLLDNGADPNSSSKDDFTPLMLSILADSYECLELLLKAGADPNIASTRTTTLVLAACNGDTRFLNRLLKARADPNVIEARRLMTPLEIAAMNGKLPAVKALFPCTSRISSFPDWGIDGIMKHINSEELIAQRDVRNKEYAKSTKTKGQEAFDMKDYESALQCYSEANSADPTDAAALSKLSLCWEMMNIHKHALKDAKACVALKPDWPEAHYREGSAWMHLHEYSKALRAFSKALNLAPNNEDIQKAHREAVVAVLHAARITFMNELEPVS